MKKHLNANVILNITLMSSEMFVKINIEINGRILNNVLGYDLNI